MSHKWRQACVDRSDDAGWIPREEETLLLLYIILSEGHKHAQVLMYYMNIAVEYILM